MEKFEFEPIELTAMEQIVATQEQGQSASDEIVQNMPEKSEEILIIKNEIRELEEKIVKLEKDTENYYGLFYTAGMDLDRAYSWSGATIETFVALEKPMTEYEKLWENTKKELDKTRTELDQCKEKLQSLNPVHPEVVAENPETGRQIINAGTENMSEAEITMNEISELENEIREVENEHVRCSNICSLLLHSGMQYKEYLSRYGGDGMYKQPLPFIDEYGWLTEHIYMIEEALSDMKEKLATKKIDLEKLISNNSEQK